MDENPAKTVLVRSAFRLFTALARVLLRYSISAQEAEQLLRRAFVEVAARDHGLRGRPTSKSRIASLTGLSRKEVASLLEQPAHLTSQRAAPNRAIRVVSAWTREPAYQNGGDPAPLPLSGAGATFESLVVRYSGDVPYRAMLRDLQRTGIVDLRDGTVHLVERAFVPRGDDLALLPLVGEEPAALLQTIDYNLQAGDRPRRFQRKAAFTALDEIGLQKLTAFAATRGQALLEEIDAVLAPHHDATDRETPRFHAGLGLHVFVDPAPP
jgi:hypothetical protein